MVTSSISCVRYENEGIVNLVVGNATKIVYFCEQNFFLFKNTKVDFMEKSKWQIKVLINIFLNQALDFLNCI